MQGETPAYKIELWLRNVKQNLRATETQVGKHKQLRKAKLLVSVPLQSPKDINMAKQVGKIGAIVGKIFSGGDSIKQIGDAVDKLSTTKEEKMALKNDLEQIFTDQKAKAIEAVTERWVADVSSDSWLSKSIRPLTLAFLTIVLVVITFLDGNVGGFIIQDAYVSLWQSLLLAVYGAYFIGRTTEKVKK